MKLEYRSKALDYDDSGAAKHTRIVLGNSDGAFYPVFLPPDKIELSNTELTALALEQIYQDNFPARAETEKFTELETIIDKANAKLAEVDDALTAITETATTSQMVLLEIVEQLYTKGVIADDDIELLDSEA
ncbi:DUF1366 domain-containing protein [Streptococcus chenjunshii]|uniref:DUF1366 domain-containing protein n=1 Tax=Streptococcus chenjunshii TaxID=2173853 RepID=A0A372KLR2_9STRE|nr:DUF1366 domain-containing protein [Streptococcus chenjunshii]AXQ79420.1 DUF1366 domain-containing protein [Streptococcus chenjunshii]RFU51123.1 DUF1366 domain-containing protein [Streptococcus chenjunshii]RFU53221.1 DUF1366 domain-containing protein [Streptococcus chenjunshii]